MEDILTYVIVFGLLILFAFFFLSNKEKKKELLLTEKDYSFGSIRIFIEKHGKASKYLIIEILAKNPTQDFPATLTAEIVLADRTTLELEIPNDMITVQKTDKFKVDYEVFHQLITAGSYPIQQFRIVATLTNNKKLKSGILAFNKKWSLYTPDTGAYN